MSHLTLDDRINIQEGLDNNKSIRSIAASINRSPSTVLREIERHKYHSGKRDPSLKPDCALRDTCTIEHLCSTVRCYSSCRNCLSCKDICPKYTPAVCPVMKKPPYLCNTCNRYNSCGYDRSIYLATYAQNSYISTLKDSRQGVDMTPEELQRLDDIISPLIKRGQSITHIYVTHKDEIGISLASVYKYLQMGMFTARTIDLRRSVKMKKRNSSYDKKIVFSTKAAVLYRNYSRFTEYIQKNPDISIVEMDTVVGCKGSQKVLLTLLFRSCNLMLAILLPDKSQSSVINALNLLCDQLGIEIFQKLFGVILTDRGTEFLWPEAIEADSNGEIKTRVFYCDPQCSWQKGSLERNHEFIRYVFPKKTSFDYQTQENITLMVNHINSVFRKKYNGACPYQLAEMMLDKKLFEVMKLKRIEPDEVTLLPSLMEEDIFSSEN